MRKTDDLRLEIPETLRRKMVEAARQFRKEPTPSVAILWRAVRGKNVAGLKFRRQQPIGPFVVDFYMPDCRLFVQIDGPIHDQQQIADRGRQELLEFLGLRFVRIRADQVEGDLPAALATIRVAINEATTPLSPGGRGPVKTTGAGGEGDCCG